MFGNTYQGVQRQGLRSSAVLGTSGQITESITEMALVGASLIRPRCRLCSSDVWGVIPLHSPVFPFIDSVIKRYDRCDYYGAGDKDGNARSTADTRTIERYRTTSPTSIARRRRYIVVIYYYYVLRYCRQLHYILPERLIGSIQLMRPHLCGAYISHSAGADIPIGVQLHCRLPVRRVYQR